MITAMNLAVLELIAFVSLRTSGYKPGLSEESFLRVLIKFIYIECL